MGRGGRSEIASVSSVPGDRASTHIIATSSAITVQGKRAGPVRNRRVLDAAIMRTYRILRHPQVNVHHNRDQHICPYLFLVFVGRTWSGIGGTIPSGTPICPRRAVEQQCVVRYWPFYEQHLHFWFVAVSADRRLGVWALGGKSICVCIYISYFCILAFPPPFFLPLSSPSLHKSGAFGRCFCFAVRDPQLQPLRLPRLVLGCSPTSPPPHCPSPSFCLKPDVWATFESRNQAHA